MESHRWYVDAGDDAGFVAGEDGAGSMVGGVAVVEDERLDVRGNRAAAASVGDSVAVSRVLTEGDEEC